MFEMVVRLWQVRCVRVRVWPTDHSLSTHYHYSITTLSLILSLLYHDYYHCSITALSLPYHRSLIRLLTGLTRLLTAPAPAPAPALLLLLLLGPLARALVTTREAPALGEGRGGGEVKRGSEKGKGEGRVRRASERREGEGRGESEKGK